MSIADDTRLLDDLEDLLAKQMDLVRRGAFGAVEQLAQECSGLAEKIAAAGLLDRPEFDDRRERLGTLYHDLQFVLSTQKDAVGKQLKSIRKGRKTLATYHSSI